MPAPSVSATAFTAPVPGRAPVPGVQPPPAAAGAAPPPARPRNDLEIDEDALSPDAFSIKKAFDENRVNQLFYPIVSLTEAEQETGREIYRIGLQIVGTKGAITGEEMIYASANVPALRQFIDRWQLRETIGRVVRQQRQRYLFLLRLSEASLADPGLFNWLRKLLAGFDKQQPGKSIGLEVAATDFLELEKPAGALISYLHKSHGFRFALGQVRGPADVGVAGKDGRFDLVLMHSAQLKALSGAAGVSPGEESQLLEQLRAAGRRILVDDIQDSMSLTEAIGLGADLAMGRFVGEAIPELGDVTGVQTVELV
jgi:EAL domain-containing protein (putative c-di-GMP-specific phosphodiesterase class I)